MRGAGPYDDLCRGDVSGTFSRSCSRLVFIVYYVVSMRIVVNGRFSGVKTGVGRVIENLFSSLQHIDHENEYFIYVNEEFREFVRFTNPRFHLISNGIPAGNSLLNHLWTQTGFLLGIMRQHADVVILPQINLYLIKLAPTILFQHDLIEHYVPNQKWYKLLFRRLAYPLALKLADKVVCVSENTLNDVKKIYHLPDRKLVVIRNGVDLSLFRQVDREAARQHVRAKFGIGDTYILYTGTLTHPQKNLLRLIDAYENLRQRGVTLQLVLAGGNGKDADLIHQRIRELGSGANIVCTGYVRDEDLPFLYNAATVFCFPSLYEGFGLPVLEAMACGCPVVTSNTSSLPEVAGDAALLVDPVRSSDIAEAMYLMITNKQLNRAYAEKGLQRAKCYTWERAAHELLAIIRMVTQRPAAW
ncbi:MAG: glycosyltransferase family 4 protein [Thermodesulfovibrionales bacterium]